MVLSIINAHFILLVFFYYYPQRYCVIFIIIAERGQGQKEKHKLHAEERQCKVNGMRARENRSVHQWSRPQQSASRAA